MSDTTPSGIVYPTLADAPNINELQAMAASIDPLVIGHFASAAARAAAIPSPTDGQLSYRTDTKVYEQYSSTSSTWVLHVPGAVPTATGSLIVGTFSAAKPVQRLYRGQSGSGDSNGLIVVAVPTMSGLLYAHGEIAPANIAVLRHDLCTTTSVVFQMRSLVDGTAVASAAYIFHGYVDYQI